MFVELDNILIGKDIFGAKSSKYWEIASPVAFISKVVFLDETECGLHFDKNEESWK